MATPTLWQLMEAAELKITAQTGLRASAYSPGQINPPALIIGVPPVPSYRAAFGRGTVLLTGWTITVLTSSKVDRIGQQALAEYLSWTGDKSIPNAIEDGTNLGGLVDDIIVDSSRPLGLDEVGVLQYFGGLLSLSATMSGLED